MYPDGGCVVEDLNKFVIEVVGIGHGTSAQRRAFAGRLPLSFSAQQQLQAMTTFYPPSAPYQC